MKMKLILPAFALFAFLMCRIAAAQPERELPPAEEIVAAQKQGKEQPPDKKKVKDKKDEPKTDLFTQAPMASEFPTGFNPHMLGDFGTFFARQVVTVTGTQTTTRTITRTNVNSPKGVPVTTTQTITRTTPVTQTRTVIVPILSSAAAFKVAENESPRPQDRVFVTWNYFGGIRGPDSGPNVTATNAVVTAPPAGGTTTTVNTNVLTAFPAVPRTTASLNREVFGFEKTFLGGDASIELRVPFSQMNASVDGFGGQNVGDLTIIGKYAYLRDEATGNVLSGGLAITAPTGPDITTADGTWHSTLIQPWFGYIVNSETFFIHAFHSIVFPTDSRDVTLLFNDVGINYWLYRGDPGAALNYIVPMFEAHLTTPLSNRDGDGPIFIPDTLILTGGVHLGLVRNATLSLGVATPVTGPRIFTTEGFMQLNWRY